MEEGTRRSVWDITRCMIDHVTVTGNRDAITLEDCTAMKSGPSCETLVTQVLMILYLVWLLSYYATAPSFHRGIPHLCVAPLLMRFSSTAQGGVVKASTARRAHHRGHRRRS